MSYGFAATAAFKPQIRQEGFHMPSNQPPSPSPSSNGYDPMSMFMLPDAFRKFHESSHGSHSMDFSEDLASLLVGNQQQQQQQQHQPQQHHHDHRHSSSYTDAYRPHTHNIFDISGPSSHHLAASATPSSSMPVTSAFNSAFALPSSRPSHDHGLVSPPSSLNHPGPLHEFASHSHFNSTLPALGSSMRFDPSQHGAQMHDSARPGSSSSSAAFSLPADFTALRQQHTPSPVLPGTAAAVAASTASRSRSRSRAPSNGPGPGPTRTTSTTRAKRNSISSTSPPPRPAISIPNALHRQGSFSGANPAVGSPLAQQFHSAASAASGGWFLPTPTHSSAHPEYSLPTPDSISSHFGIGGGRDSSVGRDSSPVSGTGMPDVVAKQTAIANEKRRRRRESHNAVERRRRDNINEKIGELATLIPECMLDANAPASYTPTDEQIFGATLSISAGVPQEPIAKAEDADPSPTPTGASSGGEASKTPTNPDGPDGLAAKANKGVILRKSVDYIRYLQQLVGAQASRNRELESQLASVRGRGGVDEDGGAPLVLHDDVDVSAFMSHGDFSFSHFAGFGGALGPVHETPMDVEDGERPGTAMTGMSSFDITSPSVGSGTPGSLDDGDESDEAVVVLGSSHEEERGRRGRDGRFGGAGEVRVKTEGTE